MYICTCWRHRCSKGCTCWCCGQGISCTCGYSCTLSYLDLISIGSCNGAGTVGEVTKSEPLVIFKSNVALYTPALSQAISVFFSAVKLKLRIRQALVSSRWCSACISNSSVTKTLFRSYFYLTLIKERWYIYLCC